MVLYYLSTATEPPTVIFAGRDKHENEDLIKWGWPEDVWFHVDKFSSAHLYVRLAKGQTIADITPALLEDVCQLTKHNSIKGSKEPKVAIVYTMWSNLKKTNGMEVGQVAFHKEKLVKKATVERDTTVINRLNKTKTERYPVDLRSEREARDAAEREEQREAKKQERKEEEERMRLESEQRDLKAYRGVVDNEEGMRSNVDMAAMSVDEYEDDFM